MDLNEEFKLEIKPQKSAMTLSAHLLGYQSILAFRQQPAVGTSKVEVLLSRPRKHARLLRSDVLAELHKRGFKRDQTFLLIIDKLLELTRY